VRIAVIGAGGVGGYYGGLLARQGHEVTFLARGAHLEAIRRNGLQIKSVHGDFIVSPAQATDNLAHIGPVDLILFCVKAYDTERAAQAIKPIIGDHTLILSLQNGIDAAERIGKVVGLEHLLGGATWISSAIQAPGVINQVSQHRRIVFGPLNGSITPDHQSIFEVFQQAGIDVNLSENITNVLWTKFVFISAISSLGALTRLPIGEYRDVPETRLMMRSMMGEVAAVARSQGVDLDADIVEKSQAFIDAFDPRIKASMQLDVEAGRVFELESLVGVISRMGHAASLPTPTADMVYAALLPAYLKSWKAAEQARILSLSR
jgi:2-dehydropantoate 2-reductase